MYFNFKWNERGEKNKEKKNKTHENGRRIVTLLHTILSRSFSLHSSFFVLDECLVKEDKRGRKKLFYKTTTTTEKHKIILRRYACLRVFKTEEKKSTWSIYI